VYSRFVVLKYCKLIDKPELVDFKKIVDQVDNQAEIILEFMHGILIEDVSRKFGSFQAVDRVNLELKLAPWWHYWDLLGQEIYFTAIAGQDPIVASGGS